MTTIAILLATFCAVLFPACLVDAVRTEDKKAADISRTKACILFGAVVFLTLSVINS